MKKLYIQSAPESIHHVESFIEQLCDDLKINNTYFGNISIALTEAFSNALHHGNKNDAEKKILIMYEKTNAGLVFRISDEGEGFNFSEIMDSIHHDRFSEDFKGRGLLLMCSLSDDVRFSGNGNTVEILFKIAGINQETSIYRQRLLDAYSKTVRDMANI